MRLVNSSYQATVKKELTYRSLPPLITPARVLEDTIRTALQLAHLKLNRRPTGPVATLAARELATGIRAFASFPFATRFGDDQAATSAAKVAYLAARLLVDDLTALPRYPNSDDLSAPITDQRLNYLNKLRNTPAALFYWQHTISLLGTHGQMARLIDNVSPPATDATRN